ncbi:MAG: hypothetical protein FWF79_08845 [Defluviitaleaceae bacterium]|nr:hypothetical protein [Defluviitaleaceae bacterium]
MDIYDVYIAYVSWGDGGKRRPVLILEQKAGGVIAFNITTRYECKSQSIRNKFFKIDDWQQAGLSQESYIDTNSTVTLPLSAVEHPLGILTEADVKRLLAFLTR